MGEITLTKDNFEAEVINSDKPVLVDFWAVWCGPCQALAPTIKEIAEDYEGKIKIGKVNVDEQMELAQKYGVMSIPTLIVFENGEVVNQSVGFINKQQIAAMVQ